MRTHPLRFLSLALALLALGTPLAARGRGPGGGLRSLHLSETQRTQVRDIHEKHQATLQSLRDRAESARQTLHEALAKAATEVATLRGLHEKAAAAQFDLMLEHRAIRLEILPLLSDDQKAAFEKLPMGPGHPGGPGFGMGHPGPHQPGR
jgi:Spy/CpxP family protein refolding chaperone